MMNVDDIEKQDGKRSLDEEVLDDGEKPFVVDQEYEDNVKTMLSTTDDVNTPSFTFRVWLLGTFWCCVLGWINSLLYFRTNTFGINSYVSIMLSYPVGKLMARTLPATTFNVPLLGECSLNPGPFTVKETVLIYIMGSTGAASLYGLDNIFVQKHNFGLDIGHAAAIGFLLATMLGGFGIAGVAQRFLVRPAHMLWPSAFPQIMMVKSFHAYDEGTDKDPDVGENGRRHMSRLKVFLIALGVMFAYQVLPNLVAPSLSYIAIICLISDNRIAQMLGSARYGTGIMSLTFDWGYLGSGNMIYPWWVQVNNFLSTVIGIWIIVPLAWRYNWFGNPLLGLPLNTSDLADRNGTTIDALTLLDDNHNLIVEKYEAAAPFWITPMFAVCYGLNFVTFAAGISHTVCWYGKDIVRRFRSARLAEDQDDIHCQLIDKYPSVPRSWYAFFFVAPVLLGIVICHVTDIQLPWYLSILAVAFTTLCTIPSAIISATAGFGLGMNVIGEFLIGLVYPGHPVAMMAFKCLAVTVSGAIVTLLQDLKIGHYMKIAPRNVFLAQMYSQIVAVLVCYASMVSWTSNPDHVDWVINADNYSDDPVASKWSAASTFTVYYNASIIWGALGPVRFFFTSYMSLVIGCFIAGVVLPVVFKLGHVYIGGPFPWALVNIPILLSSFTIGGAQSGAIVAFLIAFLCQFVAYRYRNKWWRRYAFIIGTGFDVGAAFMYALWASALDGVKVPHWALHPDKQYSPEFCNHIMTDKKAARLGLP
ncbi:OPT superfamily [Sorochytrium milnesiophthora]